MDPLDLVLFDAENGEKRGKTGKNGEKRGKTGGNKEKRGNGEKKGNTEETKKEKRNGETGETGAVISGTAGWAFVNTGNIRVLDIPCAESLPA